MLSWLDSLLNFDLYLPHRWLSLNTISSNTNILSRRLDTYHPFNSCFFPANHHVPKDVWVFCWSEQPCSWVTSLSFILCQESYTLVSVHTVFKVPSWSLAEGSESTHGEWVDWFCLVFQTQVPSDVECGMALPCDSQVQFLLFCSCLPRPGLVRKSVSCPTSTLKSVAGPQHPPQGLSSHPRGLLSSRNSLLSGP